MSDPDRVVFDCNVYFQALLSSKGPAGHVFVAAEAGRLTLYTSRIVLTELRDVCTEALSWHAERSIEVAERFDAEFDQALATIASNPEWFSRCDERHFLGDVGRHIGIADAAQAPAFQVAEVRDQGLPRTGVAVVDARGPGLGFGGKHGPLPRAIGAAV